MSEPITYVGIDAHKVELHVALLAPDAFAPVTWKVQNEARAVERLRRKLEKVVDSVRPVLVLRDHVMGLKGHAHPKQVV